MTGHGISDNIAQPGPNGTNRLGLEGLITFKNDTHSYDAEQYQLTIPTSTGGSAVISVFDSVTVDISLEKDSHTLRTKVRMDMVAPVDSKTL